MNISIWMLMIITHVFCTPIDEHRLMKAEVQNHTPNRTSTVSRTRPTPTVVISNLSVQDSVSTQPKAVTVTEPTQPASKPFYQTILGISLIGLSCFTMFVGISFIGYRKLASGRSKQSTVPMNHNIHYNVFDDNSVTLKNLERSNSCKTVESLAIPEFAKLS
ncbi:hypothetical protein BC833DRAFT_575813, partial [Globomyces pollinis-pini]